MCYSDYTRTAICPDFSLTRQLLPPGNDVQVEFEYFGHFLRIPDAWQLGWRNSTDLLAAYGQVNSSDFLSIFRPSV